jgi:hypothetical protein
MKTFKQIVNEENHINFATPKGVVGIDDVVVRENINTLLARATNGKFVTPYIAVERISKVLAYYHIHLTRKAFYPGEAGMAVWPVNQFGVKLGFDTESEFVKVGSVDKDMSKGHHPEGEESEADFDTDLEEREGEFSIFFEYRQSDCGMYNVFCELVDEEELDEILADVEAEMNDEGEEEEAEEVEDLKEENIQELSTDKYIAAKKEAVRRKKMADENPSKTSDKFSKYYAMVRDRAERRIQSKLKEDTVVDESNHTNKDKKKEALKKLFDTKKVRDARQKMKGDVNRDFDPRDLKKVAEETLDEVSAKTVGKVAGAKALGQWKPKTEKAAKTVEKRHREEWLKSEVGKIKK